MTSQLEISWNTSMQHTATHCNTLQHTATHSKCLETRLWSSCLWSQYRHIANIATHCNTLQHTATHCNTPQHTATHCCCLSSQYRHIANTYTYICTFIHVLTFSKVTSLLEVSWTRTLEHSFSKIYLAQSQMKESWLYKSIKNKIELPFANID